MPRDLRWNTPPPLRRPQPPVGDLFAAVNCCSWCSSLRSSRNGFQCALDLSTASQQGSLNGTNKRRNIVAVSFICSFVRKRKTRNKCARVAAPLASVLECHRNADLRCLPLSGFISMLLAIEPVCLPVCVCSFVLICAATRFAAQANERKSRNFVQFFLRQFTSVQQQHRQQQQQQQHTTT